MQLIIAILIGTASALQQNCIPFNNNYYQPTVIKEGVRDVQKLVLNRNDDTLYFIFNKVGETGYSLGYIELDSNKVGVVEIRNASSVTVDQIDNVVYAGGAEGLYTVNNRKKPEKLPVFHNIYDIFFKDILYFTTKSREVFRVKNNVVYRLPALQGFPVEKLIIDDENNILFTANRKLFRLKLGTRAISVHEALTVDGITVDADYIPYVAAMQGLYVYNKYKYALDPVSNESLKGLNAIAFSKKDELIYEAAGIIFKLTVCE